MTVTIAGHALEIVQHGTKANRPTIVFLHQGLGSAQLWRDLPSELAERTGCNALAYSRYGNGFSEVLAEDRDVEYMHREALAVLPELLDRFRIERPILIGHSDGGSIALLYAGRHPENIAALILEAPHVFVEDCSVRSIAAVGVQYASRSLRARLQRHHADVDRTFYGWNRIWLDPAFRDWNIEASLAAIRAPSFCIQGTADEFGTLAQIDAIAAKSGGSVDRLVLAGCGHDVHRERPKLVLDAMTSWIANTPGVLDSVPPKAHRSETR